MNSVQLTSLPTVYIDVKVNLGSGICAPQEGRTSVADAGVTLSDGILAWMNAVVIAALDHEDGPAGTRDERVTVAARRTDSPAVRLAASLDRLEPLDGQSPVSAVVVDPLDGVVAPAEHLQSRLKSNALNRKGRTAAYLELAVRADLASAKADAAAASSVVQLRSGLADVKSSLVIGTSDKEPGRKSAEAFLMLRRKRVRMTALASADDGAFGEGLADLGEHPTHRRTLTARVAVEDGGERRILSVGDKSIAH